MKKLISNHKKICIFIMSIFSLSVFFLSLEIIPNNKLIATDTVSRFFEKIFRSIKGYDVLSIPIFICIYYMYNKFYFKTKLNISALIISICMAITHVLGFSFYKYYSWNVLFGDLFQFLKSIIVIIGLTFIFYLLIKKLYEFVDNIKDKEINNKKLKKLYIFIFEKHPFIMPLIIILICWLPYIIFYYPGCSTGTDTKNQIYMYYGIESFLTKSVIPLKEGFYLNNLHPLLHSLLTGFCLDLGFILFKSYNAGLFIYTILQVIVTLLVLSYTFVWMKKMNSIKYVRIISLLLYCFLSYFPYFAITHGKDTMFSLMMLLFVIKIFEIVKNNNVINDRKFCISLVLIIFVLLFFRNDGIYRVIFSFIILILMNKKIWKKLFLVCFIPSFIYIVYLHALLPILHIPSGNPREMLSVPFQQTARVLYIHGNNAYEENDIETIKKVLPEYNNMKKLYDPNSSDPIKNTYNMYASKEDLNDYFKVWFKYLFKYPTDYIQATLNNTYGYFYIDRYREHGFGYTSLLQLDDGIFNIKYISRFKNYRNALNLLNRTFKRMPILYLLYSVGFYDWFIIILTGYLCYKKRKKYIAVLIPLYSVILINLISPVNGHYRYTLPIIFSFPILLCISTYISKKESKV